MENEKLDDRLKRNLSDMSRALFEAEAALTAAEARIKALSEALKFCVERDMGLWIHPAVRQALSTLGGNADDR